MREVLQMEVVRPAPRKKSMVRKSMPGLMRSLQWISDEKDWSAIQETIQKNGLIVNLSKSVFDKACLLYILALYRYI